MPNEERPQDFELIELLTKEASSVKGNGHVNPSTRPSSEFKSFKARFQSYVDQVPSYLHSVGKKGFFPQFFLGSFSTFIDTEVAKELKIKKIYFRFDGPQTLKVAVIRDAGNDKEYKDKGYGAYKANLSLFMVSESDSTDKKFTYGELENILNQSGLTSQGEHIRNAKDRLQVRSVKVGKSSEGMFVEVEDNNLYQDASTSREFLEVKKGLWNKPENDIEKLTNPDVEKVEKSVENILKKVSGIHSEYNDSLVYANQAREAAHHGFLAGALVNFRYRHNLRVYLEQFAGRGYADIVLVPRGKGRSLNAVPIIIELKAGTAAGTTPGSALEQAKDYAKGFQPNTMRVLTISDNVLCVGLNLDSTEGEKFSMHISPPADRKPARPTIQKLLEVTSSWNGEESTVADLKKEIKQPLERIYHTFPGTPEKGGNYFSRFLLGQLLLANEFKRINLEKFVFLYNEYPLASSTKLGPKSTGRPVTTFMLTKGNQGQNKEVFIFHVREGGRGDRSSKKVSMPSDTPEQSKITEVYINLQSEGRSASLNIEEINRYNSLNEYKGGKEFFEGEFKDVPYTNGLKEAFDEVLSSQVTPVADQPLSVDKYDALLKKIGEGMFFFKDLINEEAHFQGVLHGVFSHYSDIKLGEPQENRALVLTEFQTGMGKRIDMLIHGIKFAEETSNAKDYSPVGLELKGPREGVSVERLKQEALDQIKMYKECVACKTLTDGSTVAFVGVVFDKKARDAGSLISTADDFIMGVVRHSSIWSYGPQSLHFNKKQQEAFLQFVSHKFPNVFIKSVKQGLYLPSFEKRGMSISGKCVAITCGLSQALFLQSDKSFLSNLKTSSEIYERIAQGRQVSEREEREVFSFSELLNNFERQLDSVINSLPSNLIHTQSYKTLDDLSHYMAEVKGDFAIHLVTSSHVVAIYRIGDNYTYFDSNAVFISGLKGADQLMKVTEKGMLFASYKAEEKGFLVEHFNVDKANELLSDKDKQILVKDIKTERQLLAEQDKELGLIKVNGQEVSRVQLYDFGTKFNVGGSVPLLINACMKLDSKKFQDYLDKKEVSMTAREYLDNLKNIKNVKEVVQATKVIPFIGSKCEIEGAEQTRKPEFFKFSLKKLIKRLFTVRNDSKQKSQLSETADKAGGKPESYLSDVIVNKQQIRSSGCQAISFEVA